VSSQDINVSIENDIILRVTINRPEKHNALSRAVLKNLGEIFNDHANHENLRVAVLTGAGDKSFAAGGDLKDLSVLRSLDEARGLADLAKTALNAVRNFPVPVIAALNGNAMGGGAELAVACDFRIVATRARIGFVQGRLNISTAWGGGVDLMKLIAPNKALDLLCRSSMLTAEEALSIGLIDRIAEDGEDLDHCVTNFLQPYLLQVPQVMRAFKALAIGARQGLPRAELDEIETAKFAAAWVHDDHWAAADNILKKSK
jgi:enoyl-CoA hydratase